MKLSHMLRFGTAMLNGSREAKKFDRAAATYNELLDKSVEISGEGFEYFAEYKIARLKRLGLGASATVLDFGCGIGNLTRLLCRDFGTVVGYDPSTESLNKARESTSGVTFIGRIEDVPASHFDLVVLAGVLHHVPPADRVSVLTQVRMKLRPGGTVVVFEHNPYNPLTRRAVNECPFDDDAILLPPSEVKTGLKQAGFQAIRQDYIVFFPRQLGWFRPIEPLLAFCPLGAQTMTTGCRDQSSAG